MIHFFSVGKFVYYNIIQDFFRGEDQPPVEIQVSFAGAASPAGFLFPDRDTARRLRPFFWRRLRFFLLNIFLADSI